MDPARPALEADFFRIYLPAVANFGGARGYVRQAKEPMAAPGRKMVYRQLSFTNAQCEAAIYPAPTAAAVISILQESWPAAMLEPASFEEWVAAAPKNP